jgi:GH15 family glucan-1,4-alpha-glucosidase
MYGLGGERRLSEWTADWLPGYENSRPVRIGNAAHDQLQLDVYGEVIDALYQARRGGIRPHPTEWAFQRALLEHLERVWACPDESIWEVRGGRRHFTYSKVMAWVAFDRAIRSAESLGLDGPVRRWRSLRRRIHADVCTHGFDRDLGSFVQAYGSTQLDASLLLLPKTGLLPATDPRIRGTIDAIERRLMPEGFVMRYDSSAGADGLPPGEGAFLACSFWLADAYVELGRLDEARVLFERLLNVRNDLGLLAEEYDACAGRQTGNFPQAFSHIALVNTAQALSRAGAAGHGRDGVRPQKVA